MLFTCGHACTNMFIIYVCAWVVCVSAQSRKSTQHACEYTITRMSMNSFLIKYSCSGSDTVTCTVSSNIEHIEHPAYTHIHAKQHQKYSCSGSGIDVCTIMLASIEVYIHTYTHTYIHTVCIPHTTHVIQYTYIIQYTCIYNTCMYVCMSRSIP